MKKIIYLLSIMFVVSLVSISSSSFVFNNAYSVEPMKSEQKEKIRKREKERKGKVYYDANKNKKEDSCRYGLDRKTGKCREWKDIREGEMVYDKKKKKTVVKKTKSFNWPWKKNK